MRNASIRTLSLTWLSVFIALSSAMAAKNAVARGQLHASDSGIS